MLASKFQIEFFFFKLLLVSLGWLTLSPLYSQKTDTLFLKNGDRMIGEVKGLKYGILNYSTSSMGTIKIEWIDVARVLSNKDFVAKLDDGEILRGQFDSTALVNDLIQVIPDLREQTTFPHLIEITPIKRVIWQRFDGYVDLGFNFTKGSNVTNNTFDAGLKCRSEKYLGDLAVSSIIAVQGNEDITTTKQDAILQNYVFFEHSWFVQGLVGWESNSELGIDGRSFLGFAGGKDLLQNQSTNMFFSLGSIFQREVSQESARQTSLEGLILTQFKKFIYKEPELDITSNLALFPSFTKTGRIRLNFDLKAKIEIISDLFLALTFYNNFDSQPPPGAAARNDFGINTSIGYSF